jgi:spore coat polysaccharide biosynthesis protein SpsF
LKVAAIIQARMNSTRLPGKILHKVLDKTLLAYQIERVRRTKYIDEIIIATTTNECDASILALCRELNVSYYCGSEWDVLTRYYEAATMYQADVIVRLTSDCPVIDPEIVDRVITHFLHRPDKVDYVSNILKRSYPRGMDTEVFSIQALRTAYQEASLPHEREHVTPYFYNNPDRFHLDSIEYASNESRHRWTVDTVEDFQLITKLIEALYPVQPQFTLKDMLLLMDQNPNWFEINAHVNQK